MSLLHRFLATGAPVPPANYIEECFSTWLYTGNGSTQTITNGIDLAGKGGLVWTKNRTSTTNPIFNHRLYDSARGINNALRSNSTAPSDLLSVFSSWNADGFSLGGSNPSASNNNGDPYVSWTFREQPKFFDSVTYTGNGANRTIAHSLGSVPGCIMVKRTDATADWQVYHRSLTSAAYGIQLNLTDAQALDTTRWNSTTPTASVFSLGTDASVNASGGTYVAYLFAHNAGGFGATGTDNVVSCGSFVSGSPGSVTLGYEPQWLLIKRTDDATYGSWYLIDNMRGLTGSGSGNSTFLYANTSDAEYAASINVHATATGFTESLFTGGTYIYIAIRRGPMKVPTLGTSVLAAVTRSGNSTQTIVTGASSPPDLVMVKSRNNATEFAFTDRLRGVTQELSSAYTFSEADFGANPTVSINMNGWTAPAGYGTFNQSGYTYVDYLLSRYPNVFDEVCWTGNGINPTSINHNLTVAPTLIITKTRNSTSNWTTGYDFAPTTYKYFYLNDAGAANPDTYTNAPVYGGNPTASVFIVGNQGNVNISGDTYVSYLFATCPGVSKVGSYTGNGSSQTINCGFTTGARWVMIKRTSTTGNWVVADSARGLVAAADPALYLNSTAAEVTGVDWIDPDNSGFIIIQEATFNLNVNGASYIYLAIA